MTEPVYTYVRGKGWILGDCDYATVTLKNGERVIIYDRKPEIGERFCVIGIGSFVDDHYPNFDGRARWIASCNIYSSFTTWDSVCESVYSQHHHLHTIIPLPE